MWSEGCKATEFIFDHNADTSFWCRVSTWLIADIIREVNANGPWSIAVGSAHRVEFTSGENPVWDTHLYIILHW